MATLPGAPITPLNYGNDAYVYSAALGWEGVVDGAPVRPAIKNKRGDLVGGGRLFVIEPGKPQRVPAEVWRFINEHYPYSDVVQVRETETETGITFDLEAAKVESMQKGEAADLSCFKAYIGAAVEDYVKRDKPVPQPPPNVMAAIERRGYNLKRFGIVPIGWEEPEKDKRLAELEATVKLLTDKLSQAVGDPVEKESKKSK